MLPRDGGTADSPGSRIWLRGGGGGAVLLEGRHIDNECMRSQGRIRKAGGGGAAVRFRPIQKRGGGGGGCVLSVLGPIRKAGGEGGGVQSASGPI